MTSTSTYPMEGFVVVDASRGLAGAVATMLLADLGADVYRITPVDPVESYKPDGAGPLVWHRRKTMVNDPKHIQSLLKEASIVVITPEIEGAPIYDTEELRRENRVVVTVSIKSGLGGLTGELPVDWDILAQAASGLMGEQGGIRTKGPTFHDAPLPSYGAALLSAASAIAVLFKAQASGIGSDIEVTLRDGVHAFIGWHWIDAENRLPNFPKMGADFPNHLCEAKNDEWLHIHPGAQGAPERIQEALGLNVEDIKKLKPFEKVFQYLEEWRAELLQRDRDEIVNTLWEMDVPAQPVLKPGEAFDDTQVRDQKFIEQWDTPNHKNITGVAPSIRVFGQGKIDTAPDLAATSVAPSNRPLEGIKIVDMSIFVAGTFCSMLLADLGADVIKIEPPHGEPGRVGASIFFASNRGKRSIVLDLKQESDLEKMRQLISTADILHHNMRPGTLDRLGLGHDVVRRLRPGLIVSDMSAYGLKGPRAQWPGFDQLFQAFCGHEYAGGGADNPPIWYRTGFVDICAGTMAAAGIAAALVERVKKQPELSTVDVSLLAAALITRSECVRLTDGTIVDRPRLNPEQTGYGPFYSIYQTKDAWISISALEEAAATALLDVVGLNAKVGASFDVAAQNNKLKEDIATVLLSRSCSEWLPVLRSAGVHCAEVVENMEGKVLQSEDLLRQKRTIRWSHPDFGKVAQLGSLVKIDNKPALSALLPPELGAHSAEVLAEIKTK